MLHNWLQPTSESNADYRPDQIGGQLDIYRAEFPDLQEVQVVLLGTESNSADHVRRALYPLVFAFGQLRVADIGNLRKPNPDHYIAVVQELVEGGVFPILLGHAPSLIAAQYRAYHELRKLTSLVVVDERIAHPADEATEPDDPTNYLQPILDQKRSRLFHLALLAYQIHYVSPSQLRLFDRRSFDHLRLGRVHEAIREVEPLIRDADLLAFDVSALRRSDFPGQSPSGLTVEEACQLCRYAGLSDKLTSIGFYGYDHEVAEETGAQVVAQMVWYVIEGFHQRKNDFPASVDGLVEYIVHFRQLDYQVTFWRSTRSGRWWMQVPTETKANQERHKMVPCTYEDYQQACQDEMPERLWRALRRF